MTEQEIAELINRRRLQVLVHSIIYYRLDNNIVSDHTWTQWAGELERLQNQYPEIAAKLPYAEAFSNFEGCSGFNLPLDDPWGNNKARQLLAYRDKLKGKENGQD